MRHDARCRYETSFNADFPLQTTIARSMPSHGEAIAVETHIQLFSVEFQLVITLSTFGWCRFAEPLLASQALKPSGTWKDPAFAHPDSRPIVSRMKQLQTHHVFATPGIRTLQGTLLRARRQLQVQDIEFLVAWVVPLPTCPSQLQLVEGALDPAGGASRRRRASAARDSSFVMRVSGW